MVGTIIVDDFADPDFWSEDDAPSDALYVHRMIVSTTVSGRNLGAALLDFAERLAESRGRKWLRLDAWRTNLALHRYYIRQGFRAVRTVDLSHRGSGALFQRRVKPDGS